MNFIHEPNRIYAVNDVNKTIAEVTFPELTPGVVTINRTFVDESLRGQGIAGKLMEAAARQIQEDNKKAIPTCSYAVRWLDEHEEYQNIRQ